MNKDSPVHSMHVACTKTIPLVESAVQRRCYYLKKNLNSPRPSELLLRFLFFFSVVFADPEFDYKQYSGRFLPLVVCQ